jgi:hypothetical protein
MAVQAVLNQQIVLADFDASCRITDYSGQVDVNALESTTVCSTGWVEYVAGMASWQMTANGYVDFAANNVDAKLGVGGTFAGNIDPITICPTSNGGADGEIAFSGKGLQTQYQVLNGGVGQLAPFTLAAQGRGEPLVRSTVLHPTSTARTTSGNGTGRLLGAVSATQKMFFGLHVVAISGAPTFSVVLESDDNAGFTSPTTRITSANYSASTGAERQSVAGAITDTYWRVKWTVTGGTGPSISFLAVAGIATA